MTLARARAALGPALVSLLALGFLVWGVGPSRGDPARTERGSAEVSRWLGGLGPGTSLAGWTVVAVRPPRERAVEVELTSQEARFTVTIARRGARPFPPPRQTARHSLYYGHARPEGSVSPEVVSAVLDAVEARVRRAEAAGPSPSGW